MHLTSVWFVWWVRLQNEEDPSYSMSHTPFELECMRLYEPQKVGG